MRFGNTCVLIPLRVRFNLMPESPIKILAYEETPLGPLCLRRRRTLSEPPQTVTEITLNHEFLMSSLHTDSERALAEISLKQLGGEKLSVLVGGLGLGYTAQAALACERVSRIEVIELLPPVIGWLREGLIPIAEQLNEDRRLQIRQGDIYAELLAEPTSDRFDAILIDVDHSPEDLLAEANAPFYTAAGIQRAANHLRPGGILALWSYAEHTPLLDRMREVLIDVEAHGISYFNQHVHEEFTDWLYLGRNADASQLPPT